MNERELRDEGGPAVRRRRSLTPMIAVATFLLGALLTSALTPVRESGVRTTGTDVAAAAPAAGTPDGGTPTGPAAPGSPQGTSTGAPAAAGATAGSGAPAAATAGGGAPAATAAAGRPAASTLDAPATVATRAPAGGNGGATYRGVTATSMKIGLVDADTNAIGAVCPRCGNGAGADGAGFAALLAAWHRDGLLPIYGRDIVPVFRKFNIVSSEEQRNACVQMAQDQVFLVVATGLGTIGQCLAQEFHTIGISGVDSANDDLLAASAPYFWQVDPTRDRMFRNFAQWAHTSEYLKGQVIGLYSDSNATLQDEITKHLRQALQRLGYSLKVDMTRDGPNTDAIAAQRFQGAGVTTAIIVSGLGGFNGFQKAANQLAYHPKYPVIETAQELVDAVADVNYDPDAMEGNIGMTKYWSRWTQRKPAVPDPSNAKAVYCLKAYQDYTKKPLDVYDNDAEIAYLMSTCDALEVAREALVLAGPTLNPTTVVQGLYQLKGFSTPHSTDVTFAPGKYAGGNTFAIVQFRKARWQVSNDYFGPVSPSMKFTVP